ncbi:MAG: hypothetical protein ABSG33_09580 [Candidatus Bathyarchaeia archaeon]|jgi:hypothetical protein
MRKILKNRLALSTVVTTLIILVVSVLLAGVVTYFAINVVSTRVQQESLSISCPSVWVDKAGNAQAAMIITNTGGRDVVINQIQIRGIAATISHSGNVYFEVNVGGTVPTSLSAQATVAGTKVFSSDSNSLALPASGSTALVLTSGSTMAVYITAPTSVSINDIGTTIGMTVFTSQAMYYTETNVQTTSVSL